MSKTVLPDGTVEYRYPGRGVVRYKPKPDRRPWTSRRPADPRAVRHHGTWYLPLQVLEDGARTMPATRPDEEAYDHMAGRQGGGWCRCDVCSRGPEIVGRWQRKWQRDQGLAPKKTFSEKSGG